MVAITLNILSSSYSNSLIVFISNFYPSSRDPLPPSAQLQWNVFVSMSILKLSLASVFIDLLDLSFSLSPFICLVYLHNSKLVARLYFCFPSPIGLSVSLSLSLSSFFCSFSKTKHLT